MRIENHSDYRTDQLARLIHRVAEDELNPGDLKRLTVEIINGRRLTLHCGSAAYGLRGTGIRGRWMRLIMRPHLHDSAFPVGLSPVVPDPAWPPHRLDLPKLALTIAHEMAHLRGLRHASMKIPRYMPMDNWRDLYAWALAFPIEPNPVKPQTAPQDKAQLKLVAALAGIKTWQRKMKLAQTKLRVWRRKARYYETRLAAMRQEKSSNAQGNDPH